MWFLSGSPFDSTIGILKEIYIVLISKTNLRSGHANATFIDHFLTSYKNGSIVCRSGEQIIMVPEPQHSFIQFFPVLSGKKGVLSSFTRCPGKNWFCPEKPNLAQCKAEQKLISDSHC